MDEFIEEAYEEISAEEQARIRANASVIAALKSKTPALGSLVIGEAEIRFRLSVNKKLRKKLALYKSKMQDKTPGINEAETIMYELLSSFCVDEPWTSKNTWCVYDDSAEDTGAQEVLLQMIQAITSHMEDMKNFRRK